MKRSPLWVGWFAMLVIILGWVVTLSGFGVAEHATQVPELRRGLRLLGFCLMIIGTTMALQAALRGPILLLLAGVVLNLAYQAGVVDLKLAGALGASWVLLGAVWGSRVLRRRHEAESPKTPEG